MPTDQSSAVPPPRWQDGEAIQRMAEEVLARPEYELNRGRELPDATWLIEWLEWLLTPFTWLFEAMEGLPDGVRWIVLTGFVLLLIGLVGHIVWSLTRSLAPPRLSELKLSGREKRSIDPNAVELEARNLAAAGQFVEACRKLLQAALIRLESIRKHRFRPGLTNWELLREYSATPVATPLRNLVQTIDLKWYGDEPCHHEDYSVCESSHASICQVIKERRDAIGS